MSINTDTNQYSRSERRQTDAAQTFLKLSMGQITRWLFWYRSRCRHVLESPALILPIMWQKKTPVPERLLLIYSVTFWTWKFHVSFLSLQLCGKRRLRLYVTRLVSIMRTNPWQVSPTFLLVKYFSVDPNEQQNFCPQGKDFVASLFLGSLSMWAIVRRAEKDPSC